MNQESFLGLSPTAWVAILTVFIAMATITQAAIYGLMHSTTKRVERAYVSMSHYRPGLRFGFEGSGTGDPIWKQDVTATLKISNHGNTPARVTRVLIQPLIAIEPLRERPEYDESYGEAIDVFLVKGDHVNFPKPMRIPTSDLQTVRSLGNNVAECEHPLRLFVIGYVDYIDRFGVRRRSGYARMYNPWIDSKGIQPDDPAVMNRAELAQRHKSRDNLVFIAQSGYNYDRERSEGEGNDWEKSYD